MKSVSDSHVTGSGGTDTWQRYAKEYYVKQHHSIRGVGAMQCSELILLL